ncbi:MAG: DinB family protein [bacterium]
MYSSIESFEKDWQYESDSTLKILNVLTAPSLTQRVTSEGRSLGFLAWHLVLTLGEMGGKAGLDITAPTEGTPVPSSPGTIAEAYDTAAQSLKESLKAKWTDEMLKGEIEMYGEKWTRAATLHALVKHEIHHRAQMTVLMRQAGIKVPGIYGPSREEWSQFGMQAPQ